MSSRRVNLELIPSLSTRMATFRKRTKSLFHKLTMIKNLCVVDVCAIVKNPFEGKLEVWPSRSEVKGVVEKFNNSKPTKNGKFSMNQESHLRKTILSFAQRLERQEKKNSDIVSNFMVNGLGMELVGLDTPEDFRITISQKIKEVDERDQSFEGFIVLH